MRSTGDWDDVVSRFPIDDDTMERLLAGAVAPDDAPPGYSEVAELMNAASRAAAPDEQAGEALVSAAAAAVRSTRQTGRSPRKPVLAKLLSGKLVAVAAIYVVGVGAAAAGTGHLPSPAQNAVSDALSHVGVSVPTGHGHPAVSDTTRGRRTAQHPRGGHAATVPTGPNSHADVGLCTALQSFAANGNTAAVTHSSAYMNFIAAHGGSVAATDAWCATHVPAQKPAGATNPDESSPSSDAGQPSATNEPSAGNGNSDGGGPPATTERSDTHGSSDNGRPANAGQSGSHAPVTTPTGGATGTPGPPSGGADDKGASTANQASGGHSPAGSGNAGGHGQAGSRP